MSQSVPERFTIDGSQEPPFYEIVAHKIWKIYRNKIDRYIIYKKERWTISILLAILYIIRIMIYGGYYVVSYVLGLYFLHSTMQFVTPMGLPDIEDDENDNKVLNELPLTHNDASSGEFKPLIRSVNEFDYWKGVTVGLLMGHFAITTNMFNLPVYWPFLLGYFIFLVIVTIKKQRKHMAKYGYSLLDFGKKGHGASRNMRTQKNNKQ